MADATASIVPKHRERGHGAYPIANGITLFEGQLVQLESGYLNHWDESGDFLGVLKGPGIGISPNATAITGDTSATPVPEGSVDERGIVLQHLDSVGGTPTQAKVGDLVYCADSDIANLTLTDTTNPPVGRMVRFRSATDVDVELFTPAEHAAGIADGTWNA